MKIAVIYPEVLDMARYRSNRKEFPPFGAMYIASALENDEHEVEILKITPGQTKFDLSKFDIVAYSISASATFNMFLDCSEGSMFKDDVFTMAGGVHVNLLPEQTLRDLKPDVIGIGEGEETIVELARQAKDRNFGNVDGCAYIDGEKFVRTKPRKISKLIDNFSFPSRHLLPVDDFVMNDRLSNTSFKMTHIAPGRGCPFPCRYCASAQTRVQYRTGANIRAELEMLKSNYGIEGFAVVGNDFILSKNNVYDIADSIEDLDLHWATLSRVDRVDVDVLAAMKRSGCYELEFGVESGSQRILDAMDKRATIEQAKYALKISWEAGIKNKVFLVHGYPGEDDDSTDETIRFLDEVGHLIERTSLFRFVPLPGTYVYNNASELSIRGVPGTKEWDGDWGRFHIHHNHHHWWGSESDFEMLTASFWRLWNYVEDRWPSRFTQEQIPNDQWRESRQRYPRIEANQILNRETKYVDGI